MEKSDIPCRKFLMYMFSHFNKKKKCICSHTHSNTYKYTHDLMDLIETRETCKLTSFRAPLHWQVLYFQIYTYIYEYRKFRFIYDLPKESCPETGSA